MFATLTPQAVRTLKSSPERILGVNREVGFRGSARDRSYPAIPVDDFTASI
jgi:uncharacterized protein with GYD domain